MSVKIYHNPRCSKSRQALQLLKDHNVTVDIVEYLKTPPSAEELSDILQKLGMEPRQLMRKSETEYQANNLNDTSLSRAALLNAMVSHPILIERPIVVTHNNAIIGRPPESVLGIL